MTNHETPARDALMQAHVALAAQAGRDQAELARLRAVVARIAQMTDHWERQLPEVIRTPAVVSAIRAALEPAEPVCKFEQGCHRVAPCDPGCAAPAAVSVPPPAPRADDQAALRDRAAEAIRAAACPGSDCRLSEAECSEQRIQSAAWDRGVLSEVYGRPEWFADAVLAVLPEPADRAAVLREAAEALGRMDYDTDSHDYGYDTYRDAWNGGVMDGADLLRRLADKAAMSGPCVAGEQQNETPEAETGCAHCGKPVRLITGTLAAWWVHDPGGNTICAPGQAVSSPRATPKPAGVQDGAAS